NRGVRVSEPTWRTSLIRHLESDSPPPGKRPRVTISEIRGQMITNSIFTNRNRHCSRQCEKYSLIPAYNLAPFIWRDIIRLYYSHETQLFSINDEDWLSDDQKRDAERISDWDARYKSRHQIALINFINWVSSWSTDEPEIPTSTDKIYDYG